MKLILIIYTSALTIIQSIPVEHDAEIGFKNKSKIWNAPHKSSLDTLNLPSNATSIRQNIVDNFSCANRSYGYYADVDNGCQVFHVCLPSKARRTMRWSFICPKDTVFNQLVLVCARPIDSIECEYSPYYYYINEDIGKNNNEKDSADHNFNRKIKTDVTPYIFKENKLNTDAVEEMHDDQIVNYDQNSKDPLIAEDKIDSSDAVDNKVDRYNISKEINREDNEVTTKNKPSGDGNEYPEITKIMEHENDEDKIIRNENNPIYKQTDNVNSKNNIESRNKLSNDMNLGQSSKVIRRRFLFKADV